MTCPPTCVRPTPTQAHCTVCHLTFGSVSGFDRHRRHGACLDPAAFGMAANPAGVWRLPMDPAALARKQAARLAGNAEDGRE